MASDVVREPAQLCKLRAELEGNPALAERTLQELPPVAEEPQRAIRCSRDHAEQAVCRALALAAMRREVWRVKIVEGEG